MDFQMRQDEIDRAVLLVYKTRNTGYFNFKQCTFELEEMPVAARKEYAHLLRTLARDIEDIENA